MERRRKKLRVVSQGSHEVVTDNSRYRHVVVTEDSGSCHVVITVDSGGGHFVVTDDSGGCYVVVTDDSACSHLVVTYNILMTHWLSLGSGVVTLLVRVVSLLSIQVAQVTRIFESSLCRNFIMKMSNFIASCLSC